jgi:hypothetical protein
MPNPLTRTLHAYAADARAAFRSAPVEVALGLLLAAGLSAQARDGAFGAPEFQRLAASVVLAFPLVFALSVLASRGVVSAAARWAGTAAVLVAAAGFGWLGLHPEHEADWWRWVLLAAASVLLLGMTPSLPWRDRTRRETWSFAWRLAVRMIGIALYSVALYGVLAGAVQAVVSLFELRRPEHLFVDLAGAVFFAFAPWILVGGIHRLTAPAPAGVPEGVSRLGRWLYAPVLVIYLAVLYAYAVKVLATGELPKNLVSPLVIAAGVLGLLGALFLEPVHDDEEHRGVSLLARGIPALLLPLVPLAGWALAARLGEYGWTEFRYVRLVAVGVIGVLAVLGTLRLVRGRPPLFATVPAVIVAALLLSAIGPWSAPSLSRRDQTERLRAELRRANIDPRRLPLADTVTVDSAAYERIVSGARYLLTQHGIRALQAVIPTLPDTVQSTWYVEERLGLRAACRARGVDVSELAWGAGVPGIAAGTMAELRVREGEDTLLVARERLRVRIVENRLRVEGTGWSAEADLAGLRARMEETAQACANLRARGAAEHGPADALLVLRDAAGAARGQVVVTTYAVHDAPPAGNPPQPQVRVYSVTGMIIVP